MRYILTIALLSLAIVTNAQLKTTKLSVFKNGTFFLKKEGSVKFNDRQGYITVPTDALYGTYWIAGAAGVKMQGLSINVDTVKKDRQCRTLHDLVIANEGKVATMRFIDKFAQTDKPSYRLIKGTIVSAQRNGFVRIKTMDGKTLFIPMAELYDIEFDGNPTEKFKVDTIMKRATIVLDNDIPEAAFTTLSLQTGITWTPAYYIKLKDDKNAQLTMKGTLENNSSEDIKDADLDLVVGGNPNMFFGTTLDPASAFMTGQSYLQQLVTTGYAAPASTFGGNVLNKYDLSNNSSSYSYKAAADNTAVAVPPVEEEYDAVGEKVNNFYYFNAGRVSVKRNGIAVVPISNVTIPYKTIYDVDINDFVNYAGRGGNVIPIDEMPQFDVYQSIKFTNKASVPITSASIFLVNENDKPIAQDKIKYTPAGAEAFIRLQKAIDVSVKSKDDEERRKDRELTYKRVAYDKSTLKGTVEVQNYLDVPITLNVKKTVTGLATEAKEGTFTSRKIAGNPNHTSSFKWEVSLKAGEKKTLTFFYDVFVPSPPKKAQ